MNDKTAQRFGEVFRRFFETGYMDDLAELFSGRKQSDSLSQHSRGYSLSL